MIGKHVNTVSVTTVKYPYSPCFSVPAARPRLSLVRQECDHQALFCRAVSLCVSVCASEMGPPPSQPQRTMCRKAVARSILPAPRQHQRETPAWVPCQMPEGAAASTASARAPCAAAPESCASARLPLLQALHVWSSGFAGTVHGARADPFPDTMSARDDYHDRLQPLCRLLLRTR